MDEVLPEAEENKAPRGSTDRSKLNMCGFLQTRVSPSCGDHWDELLMEEQMRALRGVTAKGGKGDDMPPMNSRGGLSLMNPKAFIGL